MQWEFYGRQEELRQVQTILKRKRWFFTKITGRRRIGKTSLIRAATSDIDKIFYLQIPDSTPSGVVAEVIAAMESFRIPESIERPKTINDFARTISSLAKSGYIVVLDEFQYFNRDRLKDFCSFLQSEVDNLSMNSSQVTGGLFVLGSIHTEMDAILEDRSAPLFERVTDKIDISHLDFSSLLALFHTHLSDQPDPKDILFFWNLFEGVPKFYRDVYEQELFQDPREKIVEHLFFKSSSPLRSEASNWFLGELHGRYDSILNFIATHSGCSHGDITSYISQNAPSKHQIGGHLQTLIDKFSLVEKKLPILAPQKSRSGKYYISDNFLRAWLGAISRRVKASSFRPLDTLISETMRDIQTLEGYSFEKMIKTILIELSRQGRSPINLSTLVEGYWSKDCEIDLVCIDETTSTLVLGSCKLSPNKLIHQRQVLKKASQKFLQARRDLCHYNINYAYFSPIIPKEVRSHFDQSEICLDLNDLFSMIDHT